MSEPEGPTRLESVVKLVAGAFGVVLFAYLLGLLPPLERQLPGTPITVEDAVFGVAGVVVLGIFVAVGDVLEDVVDERLDGPEGVVGEAGRVVKYLVVFLAFVAIYQPLGRAVVPFLAANDAAWLYDVTYTLVALALLVAVALLVYRSLDPLASLVTDTITGGDGGATDGRADDA